MIRRTEMRKVKIAVDIKTMSYNQLITCLEERKNCHGTRDDQLNDPLRYFEQDALVKEIKKRLKSRQEYTAKEAKGLFYYLQHKLKIIPIKYSI